MFFHLCKNPTSCTKWQQKGCLEKVPDDSAYNLGVKNFFVIAQSHTVSEINGILSFYSETQDGCQKWHEKNYF